MAKAAAPIGLRVEGGAKLQRALRGMGSDLSDLRDVHEQVGAIIVPAARSGAPTGPAARGHVASTVRASRAKTKVAIRAGSRALPYAGPVHWGWPSWSPKLRRYRRRPFLREPWFIQPNPWIVTAAQRTEPRWLGVYVTGVQRIIDRWSRTADGTGA